MRVRFAPSPTGQLHVGNARTALYNWLLARGHGGTFILRIEDTDAERSTLESEAAIVRDLRWLGLEWDEGPDVGGSCGPYRSSERSHLYRSYASELVAAGRAYRCFCSPAELDAERQAAIRAGQPARYSGRCRDLSPAAVEARLQAGEQPAIRFRVPDDGDVVFLDAVRGEVRFQASAIGDSVVLRADGSPAYNFAVVIDDALMKITHVIRGEDHISNTPRQMLLYRAFGFTPPAFAHLALVVGADHAPLSKRHGATSVAEFRAKGYLPEALVNYLALVGWSPRTTAAADDGSEIVPVEEMARRFSLDRVNLSAGVFDEEKLAWVNRRYLKSAAPERVAELSLPFFGAEGVALSPDARGLEFLAAVMPIATAAVDRLQQVPARLASLFDFRPDRALSDVVVGAEMRTPESLAVVKSLAAALADLPRLDRERFRAAAALVKSQTGLKGRSLFHPIRVALTSRAEGPELDLIVPAIDRGADLPVDAGIPPIAGCRERAAMFAAALDRV